MSIDRKFFFDHIRQSVFGGSMDQKQVDGTNYILDGWEKREKLKDMRWLAYMLATTFWETARTMRPIAEYGKGRGRPYGKAINGKVYYGRGYVQLTWHANYQKMGKALGVDLEDNPELALDPPIAADIMFMGMVRGMFTGKKLSQYFNDTKTDWRNARQIINGNDKDTLIADIARKFNAALRPERPEMKEVA